MTMGDDDIFSAMALPVVVMPILERLEGQDPSAAQSLRSALVNAEKNHPGFTYDFINGILHKAEVQSKVDITESFLRLEGINNSTEFQILKSDESLKTLNERAVRLKKILSRIPDEIYDKRRFLETIKDIASSIRMLLDSVNSLYPYINNPQQKQIVDVRKREFVRYSRKFSNTLKEYFRDSSKQYVFLSANHLVHQTNLMMKAIKEAFE